LLDQLKKLYKPFFIRRTKREIFTCKSSELTQRELYWNELPFKTDLVIWIPLSNVQKKIYQMIVDNSAVKKDVDRQNGKDILAIVNALK
jgi:SNF2 family DNA or RNA helicase